VKPFSHPFVPPLVPVILAMIAGILAASVSLLSSPVLAVMLPGLLLAVSFFGMSGRKRIVLCICIAAGSWSGYQSHKIHHPDLPAGHVSWFYNNPGISLTGKIVSFSRQYPHKTRMVVDCQTIVTADADGTRRTIAAKGRVYVNVYEAPDYSFGFYDCIRFSGPIRPIRNFSNPGAFDYQLFLKRQGIWGAVHTGIDKIDVILDDNPSGLILCIQHLEKTRNRFYHYVMTSLNNRDGAHILAALVTGIKYRLPTDIRDLFAKAGTSHLLAISGLHMGILSLIFFFFIYRLLSVFPRLLIGARARKTAGIITLIPLCLFGLFSGFSPATQRAFIMTAIFMFSFLGEKQSHPINTLAGAGILILLADPAALFSISFQLSFTAVLFIILGMGIIGRYGGFTIAVIPKFMMSICVLTVLAGFGTFPLIAGYFNLVSLVQIPANLVLVPVIGFVCLPLGLAGLMVWPLAPGLSDGLLEIGAVLVSLCLKYIAWLTKIPFAWSYLPSLSANDIMVIYAVMAAVFFVLYGKKTKPVVGIFIGILILGCLYGIQGIRQKGVLPANMTITVLDVGQGNAALVRTIEGKTILVDGGGFSGGTGFDVGRYVVAPFLWRQGITTLDMVILTHPDSDHMNGLVFILENFTVGALVKNRDISTRQSFERIMAACRSKQIPTFVPGCEKDRLGWDRTRLIFFQCASVHPGLNPNDNSVVFKLELDNFSMFFPGDIMEKRERLLVGSPEKNLASTILLAPHHGSNTSSTPGFIDLIHPESVIISCGFNNPYRFPHPEVMDRYRQKDIQIFRTDDHGAVTITTSGKEYTLVTHHQGS
jgi:competence protein ComEC